MLLSCPDRGDVTKAGLLCLPYWSLSLGSNAPPLTFGSPNAGRLSRAGDSFILSASQCADRHPVKGATSVSPAPAGPPGSFTQTGPSVRQRSHSQESVAGNWAQPRVSHLYEKAEAAEVRPHGGTHTHTHSAWLQPTRDTWILKFFFSPDWREIVTWLYSPALLRGLVPRYTGKK